MNEINGWILTIVYLAIAMSLMQARKPKFSRSIGTGDIPLQWFRLNVGDMESMFVKNRIFRSGSHVQGMWIRRPGSMPGKDGSNSAADEAQGGRFDVGVYYAIVCDSHLRRNVV